jgi:hypothetical protein
VPVAREQGRDARHGALLSPLDAVAVVEDEDADGEVSITSE